MSLRSRLFTMTALAGAPLLLGGCPPPLGCEQSNVPGVQVEVRENMDHLGIADSAFATIRDGPGYLDTLIVAGYENFRAVLMVGAIDRPGSYDLCVRRNGYNDYVQEDIFVEETTCGIAPQRFAIIMQPNTGIVLCS